MLQNHEIERQKAEKIIKRNATEASVEKVSQGNDSMKTTQSMNDKTLQKVKAIHEEMKKVPKVILAKKRFLNWDPMKIMEGDSIDPHDIIKSTRKI